MGSNGIKGEKLFLSMRENRLTFFVADRFLDRFPMFFRKAFKTESYIQWGQAWTLKALSGLYLEFTDENSSDRSSSS